MRRSARSTAAGVLVGLLALVVPMAIAWACLPLPAITVGPSSSGPVGSEVTLTAVAFGGGPVEVRWNALDGPLLASAVGPNFETKVKIPEAPSGLYLLVVIGRLEDGSVNGKATTPFDVRADGEAPVGPPSTGFDATNLPGSADSDDDSSSVPLIFGVIVAAIAAGILGGFIGARSASRKSSAAHIDPEGTS